MEIHTRFIMGMPVQLHVPSDTDSELIESVFDRLRAIDQSYSPYLATSVVSRIQRDESSINEAPEELKDIMKLAVNAKSISNGYFNVYHHDVFDPSGIVKGWAIDQAAQILNEAGKTDFLLDIAGDMVCYGNNDRQDWKVGIRAPLEPTKVVKTVSLRDMAIATSGTTERGQHIYNPFEDIKIQDILSISVIGPDIIWADVYATSAFAMGKAGINWLETLPDYEGFAIFADMTGVPTSGFAKYLA